MECGAGGFGLWCGGLAGMLLKDPTCFRLLTSLPVCRDETPSEVGPWESKIEKVDQGTCSVKSLSETCVKQW